MTTATIKTECQCVTENDNTGEYFPSNECFGDCFEWQEEDLYWLIEEWRDENGIEPNDPVLITCDAIGWLKASGYKWTIARDVHKSLYIGGDFRIEFTLKDKDLTAIRYSHDEPVGSGTFVFIAHKDCNKCGEPIKADVHTEELGMCLECSNKYFDNEE
jgi:hypothetical protein